MQIVILPNLPLSSHKDFTENWLTWGSCFAKIVLVLRKNELGEANATNVLNIMPPRISCRIANGLSIRCLVFEKEIG